MSIITPIVTDAADLATLQANLANARTAYNTLMTGDKPITVTYGLGEGQKLVTYTRADAGKLQAYIGDLLGQINRLAPGQGRRRRAIGVRF